MVMALTRREAGCRNPVYGKPHIKTSLVAGIHPCWTLVAERDVSRAAMGVASMQLCRWGAKVGGAWRTWREHHGNPPPEPPKQAAEPDERRARQPGSLIGNPP